MDHEEFRRILEEFHRILERMAQDQLTKSDLENLQSVRREGDNLQWVSQDGKFNINLGQITGGKIYIGDRIYQNVDTDQLRRLIAEAMEKASQQPSRYQRPSRAVAAVVSASVAVGIAVIRLVGLLQPAELVAYDWLFQTKPFFEKSDDRIVLVEITNEEVNQFGTSEISDRKIEQILEKLVEAEPFQIGLDIFRDEAQPDKEAPDKAKEDYQNLINFLGKHQILNVCKVSVGSEPGKSPPSSNVYLSFSNVVTDGGEDPKHVRRHLLSMAKDPQADCQATDSLGYRLALDYLEAKGITEEKTDDNYIQLGNTVFEPVWTDTGGYRGIDDGGYQILLNYRRTPFYTLSATDVLDGLDAEEVAKIKGRIVLVGYNERGAEEPLDLFETPLGTSSGVEIHTYTLSHILSTVIDDVYRHPLIKTLSEPEEILWVILWCFLGGSLSWLAGSRPMLLVMTFGGTVLVIVIAWASFAFAGWWIPVIPALLGLLLAPVGAVAVTQYKFLSKK